MANIQRHCKTEKKPSHKQLYHDMKTIDWKTEIPSKTDVHLRCSKKIVYPTPKCGIISTLIF